MEYINNNYLSCELNKSRWGDCAIMNDVSNGKFIVTEFEFKKASDTYSETNDSESTSETSSVVSEKSHNNSKDSWVNVIKKDKKCSKKKETSRGIIRKWNADKGYGFVSLESTNQKLSYDVRESLKSNVFLHLSQIEGNVKNSKIKLGFPIEFVLVYDKALKKPQAFKAKILKKV